MFKDFVLGAFSSKKDEYFLSIKKINDDLNKILETIEFIELNIQSSADDEIKTHLKHLSWQIERFPFNEFDVLESSWYLKKKDDFKHLRTQVNDILQAIQKSISEITDGKNAEQLVIEKELLVEASQSLNSMTQKLQSFYFRVKIGTQAIFLVPIILSFFLGLHYKLSDGFLALSTDIYWPQQAYQQDAWNEQKYNFTDEYLKKFWIEFSNFYFNKSYEFKDLYFTEDELWNYEDAMEGEWDDHTFQDNVGDDLINSFQSKLVFKNEDAVKPILIYKIKADISLINGEVFPWERLVVTPVLEHRLAFVSNFQDNDINTAHPEITFSSYKGVGPVLDLIWEAQLDGVQHTLNDTNIFLHNASRTFLLNDFYIIGTKQDTLIGSLYRAVKKFDKADTLNMLGFSYNHTDFWYIYDNNHFRYKSKWFEIIRTEERLKELTPCSLKLTVTFNYQSLKSETFKDSLMNTLSDSLYFQKQDFILISDPRELISPVHALASLSQKIWDFVEAAVGEPNYLYKPKGVDLLVDTLDIDLDFNDREMLIHNIDVILNPAGYVVTYVNLHNLNNGVYELHLYLNEDELSTMQFEYLKPDDFSFNYNDVEWLRKKFAE